MAMSDDEILREAGRIRASRRLRVAKACARCGTSFVGIAQAKYCSDACRVAAAREQTVKGTPAETRGKAALEETAMAAPESTQIRPVYIEAPYPGESLRDYMVRHRAKLVAEGKMTAEEATIDEEDERRIANWDELQKVAELFKGIDLGMDSTELLRKADEELGRHIGELHGWSDE